MATASAAGTKTRSHRRRHCWSPTADSADAAKPASKPCSSSATVTVSCRPAPPGLERLGTASGYLKDRSRTSDDACVNGIGRRGGLRSRITVSMAAMLLPLVIAVVTSIGALSWTVGRFGDASAESSREAMPLVQLRAAVGPATEETMSAVLGQTDPD